MPFDPGEELDALVAEKVMGLPIKWGPPAYVTRLPLPGETPKSSPWLKGRANGCEYDWAPVPRYSTDIAAAWQIIERLDRRSPMVQRIVTKSESFWSCVFDGEPDADGRTYATEYGDTAPHAICLAALRAVGWEEAPDAL